MNRRERGESNFDKFRSIKPKSVKLSQEALVKTGHLEPEANFPLVIQPSVDDLNPVAWARTSREFIEEQLLRHGAILFRDLHVDSVSQFGQFVEAISQDLLDYRERAAPRTEVSKNIFTSTEFPADQYIPLHHEMSYSHNWPTKIWFFCVQPAQQAGRTPIADDRKVFELIDPKVKERFMRKKVMYIRNYGEGVDLRWQEVFQTDDRTAVEEYCRKAHTEFEWRDGDRLRTRQVRQAVAIHPKTGETVWFNHAHLFHISSLESAVREALLVEFKEDELPRNAFYGDGSPIESSVLDEIRGIYQRAAVTFPWQKGDILMLDNFLASHGREPFVGPRKIVVAMAELFTNKNI
jgi:alpha-ketoglutarate-dependent taurine dioxygenase